VSDWNTIANNETFLAEVPYGMYYDSAGTSCPSPATTHVNLGGTTASGYSFSVSSNNAVVPIAGIYAVLFDVQMTSGAGSGADFIMAQAYHNGSAALTGSLVPSYTTAPGSGGGGMVKCAASDTLGLYLANTSGSTLSTSTTAANTYLHAFYVGLT
jgi:hypothetical protein